MPKEIQFQTKIAQKYVCATHWTQKSSFFLFISIKTLWRHSHANHRPILIKKKQKKLVFNREWPKKHNSILKLRKKYVCATHWSQKVVACKKTGIFWRKEAILPTCGAKMAIVRKTFFHRNDRKTYPFDHRKLKEV